MAKTSPDSPLPSADSPIVYVVDDDDQSRESIGTLLSAMGIQFKEFSSARHFIESLPIDQIACLVTDVRMPETSGIELIRQLRDLDADLPVIVVSAYVDVADTVKAMQLGAITVLTKPFEYRDLRDAIDASFRISRERRTHNIRRDAVAELFDKLNEGEWSVLGCLDQGLANKVSASRLGISVRTVEDRRRRILEKLAVDSLAALMHLVDEARSMQLLERLPRHTQE